MKHHFGPAVVGVMAVAALIGGGYATGCASSVTDQPLVTTTTGATGGGGGVGGSVGGQGGVAGQGGQLTGGAAPTCVAVDGTVMAVDELFLGDTNWDHTQSPSAWQQFGFDLDGITTTGGNLTGHCQPNAGASPLNLGDGNDGIDNAWGRRVLPIFLGLAPSLSSDINQNVQAGMFSLLLLFEQLGPEPDQGPLMTKLYGGAPLGAVPAWDGTDCWPVVQEQLLDPTDIATAKTSFPNSTLVGDLWSSGSTGTVVLPMNFGIAVAEIKIDHARLEMPMAPTHQGGAQGLIGGVLHTEEFVEVMRQLVGSVDPGLCSGSTFDSLANQVRQASDIMADGSQDPNSVCDGISVGLGFNMLFAGLGGIAPPAPDPPQPCP